MELLKKNYFFFNMALPKFKSSENFRFYEFGDI